MKYSQPKGTFDIIPAEPNPDNKWKESIKWQHIESIIRSLVQIYGYEEIRTPIFEKTELFARGVGETSDIVSKEMYSFQDKAKRSMSLRPEGTASVMRAFVQGQLQQLGNYHKFFYIGPFFRYDRPQAGRYRQFHQFGVEAVGSKDPEQDFEVIELLNEFFNRLGIKNLKILINSLGDTSCRVKYKDALLNFLKPHFSKLSEESQIRFMKNPLRILDSKDESERNLLKNAPSILDFLSSSSKIHFESVCSLLKEQKIPFTIDSNLVRGLDYYNQTVFEITSDVLGAQNTLGAGGRYDGLLPEIGGPDLPCIGFSTGLERILKTMEGQNLTFNETKPPFIMIIPIGEEAKKVAFKLLYELRRNNISSDMIVFKKIQKSIQMAEKKQSTHLVVLGEKELSEKQVQVKTMNTRKSISVSLHNLVTHFKRELFNGL